MSTSHHHHHAAMTCASSLIHGTTFIVRSGSRHLTDPCASLPYDHGILLHSSSQVQTNLIKPSLSLYILEVGIQPRAGCACDLDLGRRATGRRDDSRPLRRYSGLFVSCSKVAEFIVILQVNPTSSSEWCSCSSSLGWRSCSAFWACFVWCWVTAVRARLMAASYAPSDGSEGKAHGGLPCARRGWGTL